ncbi:ImmA/IrrE family metallo-endopeptidase [Virgibacillus halodenitrificans]|uniref:ImmA/IrrE family metallo-endopeptidase n=1 Tax=Virgibacillus halodenitrificans TaxID=1482 RepID=UPI0024BF7743|nr:ImmA/IrrE family metallo-endopeptidase [Virgibacillus halodenitrificans]WHX25109.1 ImmA/IrrE family metallo-endopeptidase [Virgibacillus halodenitrificans]
MGISKSEAVKIATIEASRIFPKHTVSFEEPIDIFNIIEDKNVLLNFQKLDSLAGAFLPETSERVPGILINKELPLTRQRYTAAHELCHFIRNDPPSIDTSSDLFNIDSYKREDKEKIANEFASSILMPRKLINNMLKRIGINRDQLSSKSVYELSLRMDTSYQATVNRLASLEYITRSKYKEFISVSPAEIKKSYGIEGLHTSWNNIWNITEKENNTTIQPIIGDEVRIWLEENPSTGYKWMNIPESKNITNYWHSENEDLNKFGVTGVRNIFIKISSEDDTITLDLSHIRPWMPRSESLGYFHLNIITQVKRYGISIEQLIA